MPFISDLDPNFPDGDVDNGDVLDDDNRNTKQALLDSFPAITGAMTVPHTELNFVTGATANIQAQINAIVANIIPGGTVAPFMQSAAPSGWTQRTDWNDVYPRFTSGAGLGTGGSFTITGLTMPHTHVGTTVGPNEGDRNIVDGAGSSVAQQNHGHNFTTSQPSTAMVVHTPGWRLTFVDMIVCQKTAYAVP